MAGENTYDKGDVVRVSVAFTDLAGDPIDPTTVTVKVQPEGGAVVTKTYVTDPEVAKDGTGAYHYDVDADAAGWWYYRWQSTGTGQAAAENRFHVRDSYFG